MCPTIPPISLMISHCRARDNLRVDLHTAVVDTGGFAMENAALPFALPEKGAFPCPTISPPFPPII